MKLAFIKRSYSIHGGAEKYLSTLIDRLLIDGHEIHLLCEDWQNDSRINIRKVKTLRFGSFLRAYSFNRNLAISLDEFDCVISFERTLRQHIYRAGEGTHKRWLEIRSEIEPIYRRVSFKLNPLHRYYLMIEREVFKSSPLIIANSNMVKREIVEYYGVPDEKIVVIYNGVDTERFKPKDKYALREI